MRIAIIGGGISGLGAAWALSQRHEVTLFEKDGRLGGHANTVDVDYDGTPIAVDTGFIVYNEVNYPNLTALFAHLGAATQVSDMSFGVSFGGGSLEWAGDSVATLFAQKRNLLSLVHHTMWIDILRFNSLARADLAAGTVGDASLGQYLARHRLGRAFRDRYLLPMGAAIWSTPTARMRDFPAQSFLEFFANHALLDGFDTFNWRTVSGGSRQYVGKLAAAIRGSVRTGCGVRQVTRTAGGVVVRSEADEAEQFDQVVFACHADQALAILGDATPCEDEALQPMRYAPNIAVLHRDPSLMPRRRKVWSSWNCVSDQPPGASDAPMSLTYWMNRLQGIDPACPLFVTLNPSRAPRPELTFASFSYDHPQFDMAARGAMAGLNAIQGTNRTWFCGAYCGHGFHEDGLTAGLQVAAALGAPAPWLDAAAPSGQMLEAAE